MSNNDISIRHISVQNIPEICSFLQLSVILQRQIRQMVNNKFDMKKMNLRMTALIAALMMALMSFAQAQNSLQVDTALWYNQTQQLSGVVVKGRLPKTRVKGDAMRTTVAGTILEKAGALHARDQTSLARMVATVAVKLYGE